MSIFDVPLSESREPDELAHFGVKGMKWGRRRAKKRSEIKARIAKQGRAKISLIYDKKSPQHYVNGTFGTGTLRARGLSKALIKSKGPHQVEGRSAALAMPDSETAIRPPARPGSGTDRTTTTPATEAASSASMFGSVAGSASED